jgi:hypothetical protein
LVNKGKGTCVDTARPVELLEVKIVLGTLWKDIRMGYLSDALFFPYFF